MRQHADFHGTPAERQALETVFNRHRGCAYPSCSVYEMYAEQQRALDGSRFVRRARRARLVALKFSSRFCAGLSMLQLYHSKQY
jgi:hypothetical protein